MRPGPAPLPTNIRELHGNPSKRPLPKNEPKPDKRTPLRCPAYLRPEARRVWRTLVPHLKRAGMVTVVDRDVLADYCDVRARYLEAVGKLDAGLVIQTKAGNVIQNPYLAVVNRCLAQMHKLQAELGLSPSSRTRIQIDAKAPGTDEAFLFGGGD